MFKTFETTNIYETIQEAYQFDKPLVETWLNVAGSGIDNCIKDQVDFLNKASTLKFYRVIEDNNFVGYFGEEKDGEWMSTIFIVPSYRPRKKEFWSAVESKMKPTFMCGGFSKNAPACKFYSKFGKQIETVETENGPGFYFQFSRSF